jgi:SAM-dependent methyltransferase
MDRSPSFQFVPGSPADPRSLPFADASFDAIVGVGVLEHVWETGGDERASLAELARVVRPGGTLLTFHLPNDTGWIEPVGRVVRPNNYFHKRRFNEAEIRRLWQQAGFAVVDAGLYNALPRNELRTLPGFMRHSSAFAKAYDFVDDAAARILPRVCTNYFVVAARSATGP